MRMSEAINRCEGTEVDKEALRAAVRRAAPDWGLDVESAQAFDEYTVRAADVFVAGRRSDGFIFYGVKYKGDVFVTAGCRYLTLKDAREYWDRTHSKFIATYPLIDAIERWAGGTPAVTPKPTMIPVVDQELVRQFLGDRLGTMFINWVVHTVGSDALGRTREG